MFLQQYNNDYYYISPQNNKWHEANCLVNHEYIIIYIIIYKYESTLPLINTSRLFCTNTEIIRILIAKNKKRGRNCAYIQFCNLWMINTSGPVL